MGAFHEEDERIVGHAADPYHRIDIRQTSRHLTVRHQDRVIADTRRPMALYESGFAPRWYVPRADVDQSALTPGDTVKAGEACGDIESVKSVSDLIAPVTGTVRTRNDDLAAAPELVNADPYGQGWMVEVETDPATLGQQLATLLDARAYRDLVGV